MQTASLPNRLCALEEEDLRHRFLILYGTQPPPRLARDLFVPGDRAPHSGNGARRPQPAASLAAFRLSFSKNRFRGRGKSRFSRSVVPSYSRRKIPRLCSSGTILSTTSSSPPGR